MRKIILYLTIILTGVLSISCSGVKAGNDDFEVQAQQVIDSILSQEPGVKVQTISFVKTKMPAMMADELKESKEKAAEAVFLYLLGSNVSKKDLEDKAKLQKVTEGLITVMKPYRDELNEYNKTKSPDYIFCLTKLQNATDTSKIEKRIYILNSENPKIVEKIKKYNNSNPNFLMDLQLVYGSVEELIGDKELILKNKEVANNPIYQFIINE